MNHMKASKECRPAFRGVGGEAGPETVARWRDWCAGLTEALRTDGAWREEIAPRGDGIWNKLLAAPEGRFLALPYAVRVGARRASAAA